MAASLITETDIIILDVEALKKTGMSVQEFVSLVQLGIYPAYDVYRVVKKGEMLKELMEHSK
jgi:hypothetical protein